MQTWLDKLRYGNRDQAGRPDAFWLPREGQRGILITPREQAALVRRLIDDDLPVKDATVATLRDLMKFGPVGGGVLHGKTGSGKGVPLKSGVKPSDLGWFAGFFEQDGRTRAFACAVIGDDVSGKDARAVAAEYFGSGSPP